MINLAPFMAPRSIIETLNALPLPEYRAKFWAHNSAIRHTHKGISTTYDTSFESPSTLPSNEFRACFNFIVSTSSADYEASSMGWSPVKKRREMKLPDLRYVLLKQTHEDESGNWSQGQDMGGFMSFMLTYEDGYEVIYLYEIHLSTQLRGKGLGRKLMDMMEEVGRKAGVEKAMLTVFKKNEAAVGLYEMLGYEVDEFSPRARKLRGGVVKEVDYMILSKSLGGVNQEKGNTNESFKKRKAR